MEYTPELYAFLAEYLTPRRKELFEAVLSQRTRHFVVAVEDLDKVHNASAVVRTCDCFGVQELHIIEKRSQYLVEKGLAKGAEQWVDLHLYSEAEKAAENSLACLSALRARGYRIVATSPHAEEVTPADFDIGQPAAFFFGTELQGLSPAVMEAADTHLCIPMVGFTESFNISVSAAIILYDLTQRLRASGLAWQLTEADKLRLRIDWALQTLPQRDKYLAHFQQR